LLGFAGPARATDATEVPDNGSEQTGRGGAWVARASDPLAAFYNPAGLAGQPTRLVLQSNIGTQRTCFTRIKSSKAANGINDATNPPKVAAGQPGSPTALTIAILRQLVSPSAATTSTAKATPAPRKKHAKKKDK